MVSRAEVAARLHADMCEDERNGYSWSPRWGGDHPDGSKTLAIDGRDYTYRLGSFDCSSSTITAWRLALQGTPYEGVLDDATYTGNMRDVFLRSGLFYADRSPAKRGDLYLNDSNHVAMCQDGGSDGVFGYDALSQFSINENGGVYGGLVGDQTGRESAISPFYEYPWSTTLHYNGKADVKEPERDYLIGYRVHVQKDGWLDWAYDGQTAGTTGQAKRVEAIRLLLPVGVQLGVGVHAQGIGDITYETVKNGMMDVTLGTEGASRRLESMMLKVKSNTNPDTKGKELWYRTHQQTHGWNPWVPSGTWSGYKGEGKRLEAIEIQFR